MASTEETRDKLVRLVAERPGLSTEDLTRLTGVTRQRVHQILRGLGYEVRCVWTQGKKKPLKARES